MADSEPEPDLSLVRGNRSDFATQHPTTAALVIEIAVTSATEDRTLATLYAEAEVEEYWIVLPVMRRIEVYRNPRNGVYTDNLILEGDVVLQSGSLPTVLVRLSDLFS